MDVANDGNEGGQVARILLDVCYTKDEKIHLALQELTRGTSVAFRDTGGRRGGGWPEVEFTGSAPELELVVRRYVDVSNDEDEVELRELLEQVEGDASA